jgi:hypothetical protein
VQDLVTYAGRAAALALVGTLVACGGGSTVSTRRPLPPPHAHARRRVATPPAAPATVTGFWLARTGNLAGYGIEVTQNGNTFRGPRRLPVPQRDRAPPSAA